MTERTCRTCGEAIENILDVIDHATECESVLRAEDLTRREQDALLYVEHRLVDHAGQLDPEQMNMDDRNSFKTFAAAGLLDVDPCGGDEFRGRHGPRAMDVVTKFTGEAWRLAGKCRRMRARRRIEDEDHDVEGL